MSLQEKIKKLKKQIKNLEKQLNEIKLKKTQLLKISELKKK